MMAQDARISPDPGEMGETNEIISTIGDSAEQSESRQAMPPEAAMNVAGTERNDTALSRSVASAAARLSGERFARLLYGPRVEAHVSPYDVISPANPPVERRRGE